MSKKKLLLHSCCGPCSASVLERLADEYDVTVFYYNPNIFPAKEYIRRKKEQEDYINGKYNGVVTFIEGDYIKEDYYNAIRGYETEPEGGLRCKECFNLRLLKTALYAKQNNFDLFTTTLTVSPHKNSNVIFEIANKIAKNVEIEFLEENFKKKDGYLRSTILAKQNNMYRQDYCGCEFAMRNKKEDNID